nr:MAG TPA: hypothetical protein [Caudoviricetes sp.]
MSKANKFQDNWRSGKTGKGRRASLTNGVTLISIIRGSTPRRPTRTR